MLLHSQIISRGAVQRALQQALHQKLSSNRTGLGAVYVRTLLHGFLFLYLINMEEELGEMSPEIKLQLTFKLFRREDELNQGVPAKMAKPALVNRCITLHHLSARSNLSV